MNRILAAGLASAVAALAVLVAAPASAAHPVGSPVAAAQDADGRLEVFGTNSADAVVYRQQTHPGDWDGSTWQVFDGQLRSVAAQTNASGLVELFGVNAGGAVYRRVQTAPGSWTGSAWAQVDGSLTSIAMARDADGRLEVFGTNSADAVVYRQQSRPGDWGGSAWQVYDGALTQVAAQTNASGLVELFGVNAGGAVFHRVQTAPGSWTGSGWVQVDGSLTSIAMARDADGRLEVFGTNNADAVVYRQQSRPGDWGGSTWQVYDGALTQVAAQTNASGLVELFGVNAGGAVYHRTQSGPGTWAGSAWSQLDGTLRAVAGTPGPVTGFGGACVDVPGGSAVNGARMQLWDCNGTGAQQLTVRTDGTIRVLGMCLDVAYGGTANGTPVDLADCNGTGAQQWVDTASNELINPHAAACLDATNVSSANGTPLQLWACTGGANQKWNISAASMQPTAAVWMTSTDAAGTITRGLQAQAPVAFTAGNAGNGQVINVDENTTYQQFTGGGASFTDTAAWLMNSSGALSPGTRNAVMTALFDPVNGIGLDFLRNPVGASDLARFSYSFDDLPAGQTDPTLSHFSIAHDLADVLPLTRQARTINPAVTVLATPWSGPPWMKDNDNFILGSLKPQFYPAYAQYFVRYLQAYQAQGVPIDFMSVQNEPGCCNGYPSMVWTPAALHTFTVNDLYPALHAAGLHTKVLVQDFNWGDYPTWGAPMLNDPAVRNDPNFGGIAWHGYNGDPTTQSTVHDQYPAVDSFETEHTGGAWNNSQQQQYVDMYDVIGITRNWGRSIVKWSLAVDQNHGPFNKIPGQSGCDSCNGLITVHNGDDRSGQVDYTIEYYDMGQLTKFVRPGAYRVESTATTTVPNVAWRNPDGSKVLIAYNGTATDQPVHVNWGTQSFTYTIPASTTATFTWAGIQQNPLVPDLTGLTLGTARDTLQRAGLTLGTTSSVPVNESSDGGLIRGQLPVANTWLPVGRPVDITVGLWNGNHL